MRGCLALLVVCLPSAALPEGFSADGEAFVWQQGGKFVRFDRGQWSAGIRDGKTIRFRVFLWHDAWVYETLQGGTIEAGPALQDLHDDGLPGRHVKAVDHPQEDAQREEVPDLHVPAQNQAGNDSRLGHGKHLC